MTLIPSLPMGILHTYVNIITHNLVDTVFHAYLAPLSLEEISTQNGPFNFYSNSMSSCVSQWNWYNLKYRIGLKHFFNINLGICIIKKIPFLFVFSTYLPVFLLKFWSGELVGCGIKFQWLPQWVPTRHTFDGTRYPKNKKYLKKRDDESPDRNLSKNTGRYVENTNTKSIFFLSSSKIN